MQQHPRFSPVGLLQPSQIRQRNTIRPNSLLLAGQSSSTQPDQTEAAAVSALVDRLQQSSIAATSSAARSILRATYSPVARKALLTGDRPNVGGVLSRICNRLLQLLLMQRREAPLQEAARCLMCALANLTCGDSEAKRSVTLHADGALTLATVAQLAGAAVDAALGQAAASLLRNLGWQPQPACRRCLREAGASVTLMRFIQQLATASGAASSRLQCPLAALWNLTDSSTVADDTDKDENRLAEVLAICDVPDGVRCLCECLASPDVDVVESSGGVLRNLTPALAQRWDRLASAVRPAMPILVRMLDITSTSAAGAPATVTMAANASSLLACISSLARARDRRLLTSLGAEAALRWLLRITHHRSIRQDCRKALNSLASSAASPAAAVPLSPSSLSSLRPASSIASDRELSPLVEEELDSVIDDDLLRNDCFQDPQPALRQKQQQHLPPPPPPMSLLPSPLVRPSRLATRPLGVVAPMPKPPAPPASSTSLEQPLMQLSHCRLSSSLSKDSGYADDNSSTMSAPLCSPTSPSSGMTPPLPQQHQLSATKLLTFSPRDGRLVQRGGGGAKSALPCSRLALPAANATTGSVSRNRSADTVPASSGIPVVKPTTKSTNQQPADSVVPAAAQKASTKRASGIPRSASLVCKEVAAIPSLASKSNLRPPASLLSRGNGVTLRHTTISSACQRNSLTKRCSAPPK